MPYRVGVTKVSKEKYVNCLSGIFTSLAPLPTPNQQFQITEAIRSRLTNILHIYIPLHNIYSNSSNIMCLNLFIQLHRVKLKIAQHVKHDFSVIPVHITNVFYWVTHLTLHKSTDLHCTDILKMAQKQRQSQRMTFVQHSDLGLYFHINVQPSETNVTQC